MHARGQNQTEVNMVAHLSRFEVERLRQDAKVEEAATAVEAMQRLIDGSVPFRRSAIHERLVFE